MLAIFAGGVDGLWASMLSEVGIVAGVDSYTLALRNFRDIAAADLGATSFADYAKMHTGGFWTNSRMPAKAAHIQAGILYRNGRSAMGRIRGDANGRLPDLGHHRNRRYLYRQRESRTLFYGARSTRRRDSGSTGRIRSSRVPRIGLSHERPRSASPGPLSFG